MIEIYHRIVVLLSLKTEIGGEFYICKRVSPFNSRVRQQNSSFDNTCYLFCWIDLLEWWKGMLSKLQHAPSLLLTFTGWHQSYFDLKLFMVLSQEPYFVDLLIGWHGNHLKCLTVRLCVLQHAVSTVKVSTSRVVSHLLWWEITMW